MKPKINKATKVVAMLIFLVMTITSCSSSNNTDNEFASNLSMTDFSGPYANNFYESVKISNSEFVYEILKDGVITDEEREESRTKNKECLKSRGYDYTYSDDGSSALMPPPEKRGNHDATQIDFSACDKESGNSTIQGAYSDLQSNPNNEDKAIIMSKCLIQHGLAPSDYTADDFRHENQMNGEEEPSGVVRKLMVDGTQEDKVEYLKCQDNPLDLPDL